MPDKYRLSSDLGPYSPRYLSEKHQRLLCALEEAEHRNEQLEACINQCVGLIIVLAVWTVISIVYITTALIIR